MHKERNSFMSNVALENHCIKTVKSSPVGCSQRGVLVYLAVNKGKVFVNILLLKMICAYYCHIYPAVYLVK